MDRFKLALGCLQLYLKETMYQDYCNLKIKIKKLHQCSYTPGFFCRTVNSVLLSNMILKYSFEKKKKEKKEDILHWNRIILFSLDGRTEREEEEKKIFFIGTVLFYSVWMKGDTQRKFELITQQR